MSTYTGNHGPVWQLVKSSILLHIKYGTGLGMVMTSWNGIFRPMC